MVSMCQLVDDMQVSVFKTFFTLNSRVSRVKFARILPLRFSNTRDRMLQFPSSLPSSYVPTKRAFCTNLRVPKNKFDNHGPENFGPKKLSDNLGPYNFGPNNLSPDTFGL